MGVAQWKPVGVPLEIYGPMWYLKNLPAGESVLYASFGGNLYGAIVVTDGAWYFGAVPFGRFDLRKASRFAWDQVRYITILSPFLYFFAAVIGVEVLMKDGKRFYFLSTDFGCWLEMGRRFGTRVDYPVKLLLTPHTFRMRQLMGILTSAAILIAALMGWIPLSCR